jgi:hypothetical protein
MQKELTITIDEQTYGELHRVVGSRDIASFIEDLVRSYVLRPELDAAYAKMAQDEERESQALAWAEATVGDVAQLASDEMRDIERAIRVQLALL